MTIIQVDAFTNRPFAGNPAAVCVLDAVAEEGWMQDVAREMNLSETAFLVRRPGAPAVFDLRWFTPAAEVDLCGHATLASAHVLWEHGHLPPGETARFETLSGRLTATRTGGWITMDFPAEPPEALARTAAHTDALGLAPVWAGRNRMDHFFVAEDAAAVRAFRPDGARLAALGGRGVILTALADDPAHDFVSRFFAPRLDILEDPVTGSAHCALGPYWASQLGRDELVGHQASARGGTVRVSVRDNRVLLGGQAVTVMVGRLAPRAVSGFTFQVPS